MKSRIMAILALAAVFSASAVSCGTVDTMDTSSTAVGMSSQADDSLETITETQEKTTAAATTAAATEATTAELTTEAATEAPQEDDDTESYDDEVVYEENYEEQAAEEEAAAVEAELQEAEEQAAQASVGSFSSSDLSFGGSSLLGDASGIISSFGSANSVDETASCLSNGADMKIYHYSGLDVSCYIDGSSEIVYDIMITGGGYTTPKGISVGSTRTDVVAAYGEGTDYGSYVLYGSDGYGLYIYYSGDTVSTIDFYAEV